ncbi:peptide ABC transporter substrate-binding protein [Oscillochloris sp. ZM17-4]|uniref:peptide ABC transporter substrate-binding protein n=1 Tax=Oscillochloris sp. ZM17-4 TaxID=2866714 RepID=UPI0021080942|nr:peptide ABC transporter substrate-binding protein [Oscillochloris sp. ZM17-4]
MSLLPTRTIFWFSVGITLLIGAILAGCSFAAGPAPAAVRTPAPPAATAAPSPAPAPPTSTPLPRGGNLSIRLAEDLPDLRPWQPRSRGEEQVTAMLYSGLMRLDERLRPVPDLAEYWDTTPDGRTITFTLRSGLTWHDGAPLDSGDVLFTLEQLRTLPVTSTALLADLRTIEAVTTPTSGTIVLQLNGRYAPLLSALAVPVLPRHILAGRDIGALNFWDLPVGSGPFKLEERRPGQAIILSRFDGFARGAPLLDRVAFVVAPDPGVALKALGDGELQLAELPWGLQSDAAAAPGLQLGAYPENGYYFLGFNLREGHPFADLALRQALAKAVDVPRLVEAATKGQGIPISSSALPGSWADLTPPPADSADLDGARDILDAAGWTLPPGATIRQRDGITLTASLFVRGDDERRVAAARRIADAAASVGFQIDVEPADFATVILAKYATPYSFDLLLGSWSNGMADPAFADSSYYDPDDFALFHSSQLNQGEADTRATRNVVGFADSAYDNQAQAARQLYNQDERAAAISQTQARVAEQLPYIFLWDDRLPVALSATVTTLDGPVSLSSPRYLWNIERWHLLK